MKAEIFSFDPMKADVHVWLQFVKFELTLSWLNEISIYDKDFIEEEDYDNDR